MSDSEILRNRVARAVQLSGTVVYPNEWYPIADAVIAELGLREERVELLTRYVTDWVQR